VLEEVNCPTIRARTSVFFKGVDNPTDFLLGNIEEKFSIFLLINHLGKEF
jgi:hypothetical protein